MGKNIFTRILALCLAFVCLVSLVSALSFDLNDDERTDVWDLQLAVNQGKTEYYEDALAEALGGGDELHPNENGEYEIWSMLGLNNMISMVQEGEDKNVTFKLMADIDLKGATWQSNLVLSGTFDGNGHVISNLLVNESAYVSAGKVTTQGFFNKINRGATVKNLKLENITVAIPKNSKATYVGLLSGTVTGEIHDCTTVGTIIDPRTNLTDKCYYGALAGRVDNVTDNPVIGVTIDDESILMTAETPEVTAISGKSQKVLCKMAMEFAELESDSKTRTIGICGYAPKHIDLSAYKWQDISGATTVVGATGRVYALEDPILTQRRQAVVDKMYEICTVEWTPSQNMTIYYYKNGTGDNAGKLAYSTKTWKAGETYRGMPYNHGSGSLERFETWMDGTDSQGRLVTKTTLPTTSYYYTYTAVRNLLSSYTDETLQTPLTYTDPNTNKTYDLLGGFQVSDQALTMGETVSSADHAGFSRYVGNDCSQAIQWAWREVVSSDVASGGTVISGVTQMAPTKTYQSRHGVLPVGNLVPTGTSVATWEEYAAAQGQAKFFDAYAQASRGDGLIMFNTPGGHSRMVAYDPICIRNSKGVVDAENSYIITHEQGRSSSGTEGGVAWSSTCYVNCVYNFDVLYNYKNYSSGIGSRGYYMPMTLPAFHNVNNKAVTSTVTYSNGVVKSNFYILSTTVDGNEVPTSVGQHQSTNTTTRVGDGYRDAHVQEDVAAAHGDLTGKTITVLLSNGDTYTVDATTGTVKKGTGEVTPEKPEEEKPEEELSKEALNGKKIIFIGNSRTYYGKCVIDKGQEVFSQEKRTGDQGYFYQVCKANGVDITVTNFTFGGHDPEDFFRSGGCAADRGHDGHDHLADLVDRDYDYVVFQAALKTRDDNLDYIQPLMDIFLEENPNTKFVALVHNDVHYYDYMGRYTLEELEDAGVTVVDWGALVNDLTIGATEIPGGTQQCNRWTFTVNKSASDGYHPNVLSGYITAQMLFCALTGESAQGQNYSFWNDVNANKKFDMDAYMETYYKYDATVNSNTNFMEIFNSEADMAGIQQLIDYYLEAKTYRDY